MPEVGIKQVVFKTVDDGSGFITGYASTFDNWDSVGERPVRGAFTPHLDSFLKSGFVALAHNWSALEVGMPVEAYEDEHGLFVKAEFHDTPEAQAARSVVKKRLDAGKDVSLSIGYEVLRDEFTQEGRLLKDVKLYEWSIVTVPANTRALVTQAKSVLLEGGPLGAYADAVEAAVRAFTQEARSLEGRRAKEGRVLSDANRKRIASLKDALTAVLTDLDDLLVATQPSIEKGLSLADIQAIRHANRLRRMALQGLQT